MCRGLQDFRLSADSTGFSHGLFDSQAACLLGIEQNRIIYMRRKGNQQVRIIPSEFSGLRHNLASLLWMPGKSLGSFNFEKLSYIYIYMSYTSALLKTEALIVFLRSIVSSLPTNKFPSKSMCVSPICS